MSSALQQLFGLECAVADVVVVADIVWGWTSKPYKCAIPIIN